jgi:mono/diheme cytochrome c family protein
MPAGNAAFLRERPRRDQHGLSRLLVENLMTRFRAVLVAVLAGSGALAGATALAQGISLPEGPGKQQIIDSCTRCHGVDVIVAQPRSPAEWEEAVSIMIGQGAVLTDDEYNKVVTYLSTNLAPQKPSPN